jgi:hypothetical protein
VDVKVRQSSAQTSRVKLADGKRTYATLRASHTAHQPWTAFAGSFSQRCVNYLDKLLVARG